MLPLKDENPTSRRPVVTLATLLACLGIYFLWQPTPLASTADDVVFNVEHAAIPCEVVQGRPLDEAEITATYGVAGRGDSCGIGGEDSPEVLPDKSVALSVLVSMFLHGGIAHLAGNLLFLWIFGNNIEDRLGHLRYALFYLVGGAVATLAHVFADVDSTIPMVGASGAIAAVMGAYLVWFPDAPVRTLLTPLLIVVVRIRAKWVLGFWFVLQFFTAPETRVAWVAHVGGFVFGAVVALLVRASGSVGRRVAFVPDHRDGPWDRTGGAGYGWYERGRD